MGGGGALKGFSDAAGGTQKVCTQELDALAILMGRGAKSFNLSLEGGGGAGAKGFGPTIL